MKKIICLIAAAICLLSLCSCARPSEPRGSVIGFELGAAYTLLDK